MPDRGEIASGPAAGPHPSPGVEKSGRCGWSVRRLMIAVATAGVGLALLRPVYMLVDAMGEGPYTRAYNRECRRLADAAYLVGRTEEDVVKVLGEPSDTWEYDQPEGRTTTLAYSPSRFLGLFDGSASFQVHCRGGIVQAVAGLYD